jgi:pimeloyl-ACP methyl ester carboxylesterase
MPPFFDLPSSGPVLELYSHLPMSTSPNSLSTRVDPMQAEKPSDTPKMKQAPVMVGELEYEVRGDGEPVLLIHGSHIAGALLPLMSEASLESYRLIRFHRRGFVGSTKHDGPCSVERQAADALALLQYLGVKRAHIAGHSYGGVIAMQLAVDAPDVVHSLVLLEPALVKVPSGAEFAKETVAPSMERYHAGDCVGAVDTFLKGVSGANWRDDTARTVPGGPDQAERDAATFFEVEMPSLGQWKFDDAEAKQISQPILHVLGSKSGALFKEGRNLVHSWFPQSEDHLVQGVMHGLQIEDPRSVASGIANFLHRHPIQQRHPDSIHSNGTHGPAK